jgi:vacuolar-type H+-ATPase subunit E/Vma4
LVNEVFKRVAEELKRYVETKGYRDILVRLIADAVNKVGLDEVSVMVNDRDHTFLSSNIKSIEKEVSNIVGRKISIRVSNNRLRILGGAVVTDIKGDIFYNNSFDAKLDMAREKLAPDVLEMLFKEVA